MRKKLLAIIATAAMVVTMIPSMVFADSEVAEFDGTKYSTLQEAVDEATKTSGTHTITLLGNTDEDVIVSQTEGVNIIIDGAEKEYSGQIKVYGNSRHTGKETLEIKNFKFVTEKSSHDFIWSADATGNKDAAGRIVRYAHNVTVQNCTFTGTSAGNDVVGMRFRQAYNISVKDCTATGIHSLIWGTGVEKMEFDTVKVENCKNGISTGTTDNVSVKNSSIKATDEDGYGIRADGGDYNVTIENCNVEAFVPVLVRNVTSAGHELEVKGNNEFIAKNPDNVVIAHSEGDYDATKPIKAPNKDNYETTFEKEVIATFSTDESGNITEVIYKTVEDAVAEGATFEKDGVFYMDEADAKTLGGIKEEELGDYRIAYTVWFNVMLPTGELSNNDGMSINVKKDQTINEALKEQGHEGYAPKDIDGYTFLGWWTAEYGDWNENIIKDFKYVAAADMNAVLEGDLDLFSAWEVVKAADGQIAEDTDVEDSEDAVDTGDNMNTAIPFAIGGLALAAMAAVVATRRRTN